MSLSEFFTQERIALSVVALAVLSLLIGFYRGSLAGPLSRWLLARGQVKLAMRVHAQAEAESGCGGCANGPNKDL